MLTDPWFIALQLGAVSLEVAAWYFIKRCSETDGTANIGFCLLAMLCYCVIVLLAIRMVKYAGIGVSNAIWNVLSTLAVTGLGIYLFSECYSVSVVVGLVLGCLSLILLGNDCSPA